MVEHVGEIMEDTIYYSAELYSYFLVIGHFNNIIK